mgnify:CR=1 FL=1
MQKATICIIIVLAAIILMPPSVRAQQGKDYGTTTTENLLEPEDFYQKNAIPLSLRQAIVQTLNNNLNIRISEFDMRIAEAEIQVQKAIYDLLFEANVTASSNEIPQPVIDNPLSQNVQSEKRYSAEGILSQLIPTGGTIGIRYNGARTETNSTFVDINPYYTQGASVFINHPLLRNFGTFLTNAGIRIAKNSEQIQQEAFIQEIQNQISEVTRGYWDLVFAIENYKVQRLSLTQARDFMRITNVSYETGVVPETDVLQARARVAVREENVIRAESAIKAAEDYLKTLMNIPRASKVWEAYYVPVNEPDIEEIPLDTNRYIEQAFANRPEYIQSLINLENVTIEEKVAENQRLPQLNLFASAGRNGLGESNSDAWDELHTYDYHNYEAGLQFSFPLQNRRARYKHKQAKLNLEKSHTMIKNLENQIILEIRNAVRSLETERKRIEATSVSVEAQKAMLDSEMQRYRVGMSTSYNVLEFQQDYAEALSNNIGSRVEYKKAQIALEKAKGTLLRAFNIIPEGVEPR